MKINKIKLYNFSSYEGENVFDFSCDDKNRNIILIGGKNGAGKTSLFTAIKVALYGPLAYGYVGVNSHYIMKIKDLINSKAFQQDKVETEVQITISLKKEREMREYIITRKWNYSKKKLSEEYYVEKEGKKLSQQELSYFQNYLQSIVPPDLFEFFLFDGEEVGNIFSTSSYNTYVKNAVFTLCGMDIFEIIRKYTEGYISKTSDEENDNLYIEFEEAKKEVERLEVREKSLLEEIEETQDTLNGLEIKLTELETEFKNAGGITEKERKKLQKRYKAAESKKVEAAAKMKIFVEGMMPFLIVREFAPKIKEQINYEEKEKIYDYISKKLVVDDIKDYLSKEGVSDTELANRLLEMILGKFKPEGNYNSKEVIFDLSKAEMNYAHGIISSIENFDIDEIVKAVKERMEASVVTVNINRILKSAMRDEDAIKFAERENLLLREKEVLVAKLYETQKSSSDIEDELQIQQQLKERIFQSIKLKAQNKHVYELSAGLSKVMEELLKNKTIAMRLRLEELVVQNLKHIYRKNNLITHVEITEDFQFKLYQDEVYNNNELLYLIKNLGNSEFGELIGEQGTKQLFEKMSASDFSEVRHKIEKSDGKKKFSLYKKIELSRLSKGERQIFILSLYWAIIMLSGQDIPFIIDTPYARIDANHRKEISEKFFPSISKQVIILSTDEEVNEEYYNILKPHISKEYMLVNDENQNRTSVEEHYFFEE